MRILQILPELNLGGVETGTVDFAKYLKTHGHEPVVVSNGGKLVDQLKEHGIRHYTLPVHKKSLWSIFRLIRRLRKIIADEQIDIVHARSRVPGWIAYFACMKTQAQFITTCHGYYSAGPFSWVMGWPKLVIAPSEVIGRHMVETFKVSSENIRIIPRSVDLERFKFRPKKNQRLTEFVVTIAGRITPLKGHVYFFKAMAKVVRSQPYVKVWVIGEAPAGKREYMDELEILLTRLGLKDRVEFLGNRSDMPELLAKSDVVVMASIRPESFGRVVIEAQAAGTPVVATRIGGLAEIIEDRKTGLLVPPRDPDAMALAVLEILNKPGLSEEMASAARLKVEQEYHVDQMCERTLKVYDELMASMNILVIKMSAIGDVILVTPSLRAIRKRFPQARICCLVGQESRKILQRCPYIDDLVVINLKDTGKSRFELLKFSRKLAKRRFDKVIDFQNNLKSHMLAFLSFPRESYGFNNGKAGFLLSHPVKNPIHNLAPVEHQFQVLDQLGMTYKKEDCFLELWPSDSDRDRIQAILDSEWLGNAKNIVGINVAASERWATKNWPLESIAELCDTLSVANIRVVLTGTDKDVPKARQIMSLAKSKPANFAGKTQILELAALIKRCRVFVTPDSAPLHIAAAMNTPVVAFFGPTDSARHLPPLKSSVVFERKPLCAPCYSTTCKIATHVCMREILPKDVASQVFRLMEET